MSKPHRIAAGGIIFKGNAVLLVRYHDGIEGTFLVCPGGALNDDENIIQAVIRETKEETGIIVKPKRVVVIEDLMCSQFKMSKTWMICDVIGGEIQKTVEAETEGIIEVDWFTKEQLAHEIVHPSTLMQYDWSQLRSETWQVECLPSRKANF